MLVFVYTSFPLVLVDQSSLALYVWGLQLVVAESCVFACVSFELFRDCIDAGIDAEALLTCEEIETWHPADIEHITVLRRVHLTITHSTRRS